MPSPNGYLSGFSYLVHDRQSFRTTLTHDINSPPWLPGQAGSYTLVWETGPTAAGPWTAAPLTDLAVGCTPQPDNETTVGGVTSTLVRIGDPTPGTGTTADTDYFVRVTVLDPTDVQVDQWVLDTPAHTEAYPTFVCGGGATGETTADIFLGATAGQVNISAPCNEDSVVWELATTPGGPYTASPSEPVDGLSPGHTFTGLAAGTTYYWRGRLTEQAESGGEYLVSQECTFTTEAAVAFAPECSAVGPFTTTSGRVAGTADGVPADHTILLALGTAPGDPYATLSPAAAGTGATNQPVIHTFASLTPATTYYFRTEVRDAGDTVVESSTECSFTTAALPGPSTFDPQPCDAGAGADAVDVEQFVLCDLDAEGNLLGTALAVYEYDSEGNPTGAPTFVDPTTGAPYVAQGTLQPCPDAACLPPMQFCQTSTTTGPVDHPGRQYDITLPINPGFAVQSLQVDAVSHAAGITWEVDDPDGETFRQNLTNFIEGRVPAAATVTITNPNAGVPQVCGAAQPMTVHIECIRLDEDPPDLIELVYNGGQDLIQNPAYNEFPALDPPVSQGNYGFHLLSREDDPGPFPGNPPAGEALCTSVANRGWETNDVGRTFEIWGQDVSNAQNTTPTPRGTPVQEITSDGPPPGGRSTIWQTFVAPASGNFIIRVVHGARDNGEQHRITLDNGDTNDTQNGDLIDDISNPPSVTSSGGPNPWTQFSQTIPLNGGSTYTLALSTNNPVGGARGGLFTDMRAFIDRPDLRATATTDDDTCVVTTEETTTNTVCSFWQPQCVGGVVAGWQKTDTGETLTNAEFWAQVPTPGCCLPGSGGDGEASSTLSNMLASEIVCATVGGIPQNAIRVMVTDPSGGTLQTLYLGTDGAPIAPDTWTPGPCTTSRYMADQVLCDDNGPFLRKYVQSLDATNQPQVNTSRDFTLAGAAYTPVGTIGTCAPEAPDRDREVVCWTQTSTGDQVHTGTIRHDDSLPAPGWLLFDQHQTPVSPAEPGLSFVPCGPDCCPTVVGDGCWETASPAAAGRWTSLRMPDGTILLVDQEDGHTVAPADVVACPLDTDSELVELCDDNGIFLRRYLFDGAGNITGSTDLDLAGDPYVPVGTVTYGCTNPTATAQVIASCDDVGSEQFNVGSNLLANGDFSQSSGLAAASIAGPGWVTNYTACGPNLFAAPCGAATWAFFNTNAGQVTGGNAAAIPIEALGARSMAVNVGPNTALPIIEWQNVFLENGKTYELSADAAIIIAPYDVAVKIGGSAAPGGLFPLSAPPVSNWGKTTASFTYAGTTGYTSVGLYSNSGAAGGNDHAFDNFSLHEVSLGQAETLTPVIYSGTQRAVIDQVVESVGCNDDRRDALLGDIADAVTPRLAATLDSTLQRQTNAGTVTVDAGARSVTVMVLTGPVTVNLGQGVTTIPTGATLTWSVDGPGETLAEAFAFTGVAGSDFIVTSTRQ